MNKELENHNNKKTKEDVISEILDVQTKELEVRELEVQANAHESANNKEIALASIHAQKEDRKETRFTYERESTKNKLFAGAVLLVVILFVGFLIIYGEKDFAKNLVDSLLKIGVGFVGGYGIAYKVKSKNQKNDSE